MSTDIKLYLMCDVHSVCELLPLYCLDLVALKWSEFDHKLRRSSTKMRSNSL